MKSLGCRDEKKRKERGKGFRQCAAKEDKLWKKPSITQSLPTVTPFIKKKKRGNLRR